VTRPFDDQKVRCLSKLTGEQYNEVYDPQGQTDVQRSWLYNKDPSLVAASAGYSKKEQTNFFDNALSLPMGDGVHCLRKFSDAPGHERHKRSDVILERCKNKIITKK
jgi:hypothetical protein